MATPFQAQGTVVLPEAPGLPATPVSFGIADQYESLTRAEFLFTDTSGTQVVDFGTIPEGGAKCVFLTYVADSGITDVALTINGADHSIPVSPGGFLLFASPVPATGVTSLSIAYTGAGRVSVWLMG